MAITLEVADNQEHVNCPRCLHKWWTTKVLPVEAKARNIYCPECRAPLKPPVLEYQHKPKEKTE